MQITTIETPRGTKTMARGHYNEVYSFYLARRHEFDGDSRYRVEFHDGTNLPSTDGVFAPSRCTIYETLE